MKLTSLIAFICVSTFSIGQSTVTRDTLTDLQQELSITYNVSTDISNLDQVVIHQYSIVDSDTISIFMGTYSFEDDDPSDFLKFTIDESIGLMNFGIGSFAVGVFYAVVKIEKLTGLPEEFIFN